MATTKAVQGGDIRILSANKDRHVKNNPGYFSYFVVVWHSLSVFVDPSYRITRSLMWISYKLGSLCRHFSILTRPCFNVNLS